MTCRRFRSAISARLDGEEPGLDDALVDAHLERCVSCREFAASATRLRRASRLSVAEEVPDLSPAILATVAASTPDELSQGDQVQVVLRWVLVALAIVQIAVAVPSLVFGSDAGASVHVARHIGSFDIAVAVGFLFAAWRPSRISGLLPVVAALVACLVASSMLDVLSGNAQALGEAHHGIDFAGLAVLWLLSRTTGEVTARVPRPKLA
jgi:predicted anti-sigma-YlaC factor YlaD